MVPNMEDLYISSNLAGAQQDGALGLIHAWYMHREHRNKYLLS